MSQEPCQKRLRIALATSHLDYRVCYEPPCMDRGLHDAGTEMPRAWAIPPRLFAGGALDDVAGVVHDADRAALVVVEGLLNGPAIGPGHVDRTLVSPQLAPRILDRVLGFDFHGDSRGSYVGSRTAVVFRTVLSGDAHRREFMTATFRHWGEFG